MAEATTETPPAEEAPAEQPPAPEVDLSPITDRMQEVMDRLGNVEQRLPEPQEPEPEPYQFAQPQAPANGQPSGQPEWQAPPDPNDPNYIAQVLRMEAQRVAQETMAPELQRLQQQRQQDADARRRSDAEQMLEEYPELKEQKAAQELVNDAQQWAQDIVGDLAASGVDPQLAKQFVGVPAFLELVHLAAKTADRAGEETPPGQGPGQEVTLESGGAPNPGGAEAPQALGAQIKAAGRPKTYWT